jgi:hypothetical protein
VALVRMHIAAVPAAVFALAVTFAVGVVFSPGPVFGIITVILGGSGALLLYVLFAKALGITEVTEITAGLRTRLRR